MLIVIDFKYFYLHFRLKEYFISTTLLTKQNKKHMKLRMLLIFGIL